MESAQATQQLVRRLAKIYPNFGPAELMRIGLLVALHRPDLGGCDDSDLQAYCQELLLQMNAASDQHAAVADELDSLAATTPCDFSPSHIWTLVRAIKVQSQVLNLYLGPVESTR